MSTMTVTHETILEFWFGSERGSPEAVMERVQLWFIGNHDFDEVIRSRFRDLPEQARAGDFDAWRNEARSCVALVLVLDQFPRNLYRGSPRAYAFDAAARAVAEEALARGHDAEVEALQAAFLYLPLEHAEDLEAQHRCVELFGQLAERAPVGLEPYFASFLDHAIRHREVIERFGRFPHRNARLGRQSTADEEAYLAAGGETFGG